MSAMLGSIVQAHHMDDRLPMMHVLVCLSTPLVHVHCAVACWLFDQPHPASKLHPLADKLDILYCTDPSIWPDWYLASVRNLSSGLHP